MRFNPAYPAMLAKDWKKKGEPDPTGWWASEKYDGLRALWDGENFYSRNGKIFNAPQWFKDTLPRTALDGELWLERGVAGFQKAVSAVRKKVGGKEWGNITYIVFDIPTSTEPFEKVQAKLKRMDLGPYAEVAPQYKVRSRADMLKRYEAALSEGAEGIMLRKPGSKYSSTRSMSLLKVKPEYDAEAVVTGYQAGTGKHQGRMGALHVYLYGDKSKVFKVGTGFSDREREDPPPIGSIIEIKFSDKHESGIPRHPRFHRIRTDMMADRPKRKATKPKGKRVLFSGSRHWDRVAPVRDVISSIPRGSTVIHGGAKGLDSLAGRLAQERGLKVEVYEADWSRGRKAGPERNQEMVDAGADIVYAFPVEGSRGTWDLVKRAQKAGLKVQVYGEDFGTTKRKAAEPTRKKTMAKKFKWPDYGGVNWDDFQQDEGDGRGAFYFREVYGLPGGRVKLYASAKENKDGTATVSIEGREKLKLKFPSPAAAAKWLYKVADSEDDPTRTKPKREKAKREAKGKSKPKATKPVRKAATKPKRRRDYLRYDAAPIVDSYFQMSKTQLVNLADADAGARKELKRRGRDAKGRKL